MFEKLSGVIMRIMEILGDDESAETQTILDQIDEAESDDDLKDGIRKSIERMRQLGKTALADEIESSTKGYI